MFTVSKGIEIPTAEHKGIRSLLWFRCSICGRFSLRRNRWTLADAYVCQGCAEDHNTLGESLERSYSDAQRSDQWDIINAMLGHCDINSSLNAIDSPGALWLTRIHDAMEEEWENGRFGDDSEQDESAIIFEMADSMVPIYTHNRWQVFTDLCAYSADVEPEFWVGNGDLTKIAGIFLLDVARTGMNSWLEGKREDSKCEKCDEFPCECCEECGEYFDCECDPDE